MYKIANYIQYPADEAGQLNFSRSFANEAVAGLNLCVTAVYSYRLSTGGLSGIIQVKDWVLEYHSKYAGRIHFLSPGGKNSSSRQEGAVHLYAPGCFFREDTRKSNLPLQETYIRFKGGELCGLDRLAGGESRYCRFIDLESAVGKTLEKCAFLCSTHGEKAFWEVQSMFTRCLHRMLDCSRKISADTYELSGDIPPADPFVENIESFMRKNLARKLKNSDMADYMNLSESGFNHKFREKTGTSPRARMLEMRVDAARGLLLKGRKLKEIAGITGFHDEFHLSSMFKKITGVSPAEFRRMRR